MSDDEKLAFLKAKLEWYIDYHSDEYISDYYGDQDTTGWEIRWTREILQQWLEEMGNEQDHA